MTKKSANKSALMWQPLALNFNQIYILGDIIRYHGSIEIHRIPAAYNKWKKNGVKRIQKHVLINLKPYISFHFPYAPIKTSNAADWVFWDKTGTVYFNGQYCYPYSHPKGAPPKLKGATPHQAAAPNRVTGSTSQNAVEPKRLIGPTSNEAVAPATAEGKTIHAKPPAKESEASSHQKDSPTNVKGNTSDHTEEPTNVKGKNSDQAEARTNGNESTSEKAEAPIEVTKTADHVVAPTGVTVSSGGPIKGTDTAVPISKQNASPKESSSDAKKQTSQPVPLKVESLLAERFIPQHFKAINLRFVRTRWICGSNNGERGATLSKGMDEVTACLAREFIPFVPCVCQRDKGDHTIDQPYLPPHGLEYYKPSSVHRVPSYLRFAIDPSPQAQTAASPNIADLDETTSIDEYCSTFNHCLKLEHEERLRLFENFSLFEARLHPLKKSDVRIGTREGDQQPPPVTFSYDKAFITIPGISDARPSLQPDDIVLLRPIQPICILNYGHMSGMMEEFIEIESRILAIVRGRRGEPDKIIINWQLSPDQIALLRDQTWVRQYTVRFVPSSMLLERCLTSLDWLHSFSSPSHSVHEMMKNFLFPVVAPSVKSLGFEHWNVVNCLCKERKDVLSTSLAGTDVDEDKPLNELQSSFVRMVRARTMDHELKQARPPMILTGPAGTGKTKTLIVSIAEVLGLLHTENSDATNKNRVLVCAPSHAAADVISHRLGAFLSSGEIFRMYDASRPINTVPGHILPFTIQKRDQFSLPPPEQWIKYRVIVCTCVDSFLLYRAKITNHDIRSKRNCFCSYLSSSNNTLGISFDGGISGQDDPFFSHLFIDEAAQATEPEILIPLSCVLDATPGNKKVEVALIGDPRQLSPKIFSNVAAGHGLGRSFMERLLRRPVECMGGGESHMLGPIESPDSLLNDAGSSLMDLIRYYANVDGQEHLTIFLTENYRGHPSFLMMPSSFFYFDRLRSAKKNTEIERQEYWMDKQHALEMLTSQVLSLHNGFDDNEITTDGMSDLNVFCRLNEQSWPIHFRGVKGKDASVAIESFSGTDSWQNNDEVDATVEIVSVLIRSGVNQSEIGVMASFRGQVVAIRRKLRYLNFFDVNVGTVENYQAVEQDVIIFSVTRSNSAFVEHDISRRMGVFGQPKQANVALTRAENLFIVIGNPDTLWKDALWRQWLWFCFRNGLWYGEGLSQGESIPVKEMKFCSMLEQVKDKEVVVSTIEKIHRQHMAPDLFKI